MKSLVLFAICVALFGCASPTANYRSVQTQGYVSSNLSSTKASTSYKPSSSNFNATTARKNKANSNVYSGRRLTTFRTYHRGARGGCYYYSGSRKVYVDRSYC